MTREAILEAAAQIFSQKGYHAASMQNIAEAVNLQKASLYHHVSSKQEILLALLDQGLDLLTERIEGVLAQNLTPAESLKAAMQAYLATLAEHRELAAVLLLEHRSLSPELQARHIPRRDQFEGLWASILQQGVEAGVFAIPDLDMAVKGVLGLMNWTVTWYNPQGRLNPEEIAGLLASLLLDGLVVRTGGGAG